MIEPSLPDPALAALHEAMADLSDQDRLLLSEHYFEKTPLEDLGQRDGVSAVAVWKRLEKAKERLRRGLAGAGFAVGMSQVTQALEKVEATPAPAGLLGGNVAATLAAGGLTVTSKNTAVVVVGTAALFLLVGTGGGYLLGARRQSAGIETARQSPPMPPMEQANLPGIEPPASAAGSEDGRPASRAVKESESPASRLTRFRNWHREWKAEKWKSQADYAEHLRRLIEQGPELRQILMKEIEALLEFARDPGNAECLSSLFQAALHSWVLQQNGQWAITGRPFVDDEIPSALTDGLLAILAQGSETQQLALIGFGRAFTRLPDKLLSAYRDCMMNASDQLLMMATHAIRVANSVTPADLEVMKRNAQDSSSVGVRSESYKAIATARTVDAFDWFFSQLLTPGDSRTTNLVAAAIRECIMMHNPFPKEVEPKAAAALISAMERGVDDYAHGSFVYAGLCLSGEHTLRVLEAAVSEAPTDDLRRKTQRIMASFQSGERNASRLWSEYVSPK